MNIKTKSIITLCLTVWASMPLSAQCYMGSVVDIDGTWTTAKNIKVEESQIVFTDHNGEEHTISNSHGNRTPVKVIHDVLYADGNNSSTLTDEMVEQVKRCGKLVVFGYLNDGLWDNIGGKTDGITSAYFYNLSGKWNNSAYFITMPYSSLSSVKFVNCKIEGVGNLYQFLKNSGITEFSFEGLELPGLNGLSYSFCDCSNLQKVSFVGLDTSKVTSVYDLFTACSSLTEVDFSGCNLESVTNYGNMFLYCNSLKTIKAIGCTTTTIEILQNALNQANLSGQVTIVTDQEGATTE